MKIGLLRFIYSVSLGVIAFVMWSVSASAQYTVLTLDNTRIAPGQCANLTWVIPSPAKSWTTENFTINIPNFSSNTSYRQTTRVCPQATTTYKLYVTMLRGSNQQGAVTLVVSAPSAPSPNQPKPTTTVPPCVTPGNLGGQQQGTFCWDPTATPPAPQPPSPPTLTRAPTQTPTAVPPTSTRTLAATPAPTLTAIPTDTATAVPPTPTQPPPTISLYADPPTVVPPNCSTIRWDVENARAVFWGTEPVSFHSSSTVCPKTGTVYQLVVTPTSGPNLIKLVAVNVGEPVPAQPIQHDASPKQQQTSEQPVPQQPVEQPATQQPKQSAPYVKSDVYQPNPQDRSSTLPKPADSSGLVASEDYGLLGAALAAFGAFLFFIRRFFFK